MDFSEGLHLLPALNNEATLLAAAIKIRAELDKEFAYTRVVTQEVKHRTKDSENPRRSTLGSTHRPGGEHGSCGMDSRSFKSPASSYSGIVNTSQESPGSTSGTNVASGSLLHSNSGNSTVVSSPGTGKIKKATRIKHAPHGLNLPSDKKPHGRGHSKKRKPDSDPNAPKKPSNAFFWFCQEMRPSLQEQCREEGLSGQHDLTKALAKLWSETKTEDKKVCECVCACTHACLPAYVYGVSSDDMVFLCSITTTSIQQTKPDTIEKWRNMPPVNFSPLHMIWIHDISSMVLHHGIYNFLSSP